MLQVGPIIFCILVIGGCVSQVRFLEIGGSSCLLTPNFTTSFSRY